MCIWARVQHVVERSVEPVMPASVTALLDKIRALEALVQSLEGKNGALESALVQHALEIELLQRKLYGTKSEKSGTSELQLLLEGIADTNTLQKLLDDANANKPKSEENEDSEANPPGPHGGKHGGSKAKPKGRRDLSASKLPQVEVEITDPVLAAKGEVIGHDESRQLLYVRGGFRVLVKRVARYKLAVAASDVPETTVLAATTPPSLCRRSLCSATLL
jgi:transposase